MSTREQALTAAKILSGLRAEQVGTGVIYDAIRRVCEYVGQEPDAALWAEIDELLRKLNKHDRKMVWDLARRRFAQGLLWRVIQISADSICWNLVAGCLWAELTDIRDQLRTLATERGLLTPSLAEIRAIVKHAPDGCQWTMCTEHAAQIKAFIAALVEKGGE